MPILGIDYEKCNNCKLCVKECRMRFLEDKENSRIVFSDPTNSCSFCGHCVAVCPNDAVLYQGLGDIPYRFKEIRHLDKLIPYETIHNFLRAQRSIRHYKQQKVPQDLLRKVITTMGYAPTGANVRSEKFAVLSDPEQISTLSKGVLEELLKKPSTRSHYEESFSIRKKFYKNPVYFDAPHLILVYSSTHTFLEAMNIGIIITYGRLAAQSLGLGTCWNGWTQIAFESNKKLLKTAGIRGRGWGAFTIGYPDISFGRCPPRKQKRIKGLDY